MMFATRLSTHEIAGRNPILVESHTLRVEDRGTNWVDDLMGTQNVDLLAPRSPVLAEPLSFQPVAWNREHHRNVQSQHQLNQFKLLGLGLIAVALVGAATRLAKPLLGLYAARLNTSLNLVIVAVFFGISVRRRMEVQATGAATLLSEGFDKMQSATRGRAMAERFARQGNEAMRHAQVLGMTDARLLPAAKQYAQRYNDIFGLGSALS